MTKIQWNEGRPVHAGAGVIKSADVKGWTVEIITAETGGFDLYIEGERCNWSALPTLDDALECAEVVNKKLRQKVLP